MQVFNAKTQQFEDVEWSTDHNSEIVCTFKDGHFYKFPAGLSKSDLEKHVKALEVNQGQEIITPEMEKQAEEARQASEKLITELRGGKTNATDKEA